MAGEPQITVVGNLATDPEPRVSQAGASWTTFRLAATPRVRGRQTGDWVDGEALWLGCRAYGEQADNIVASLTKGARVIVQGRLSQRSYTDNQGQQRTALNLEIEDIGPSLRFATAQITRTPRGPQGWPQQPAPQPQPQQAGWAEPPGDTWGGFDDEEPF